jgi:hypothetical protein
MKSLFIVLTVITVSLLFSSSLWAETVYFKNGEEIECQSYRQQDDKVYVNVNSETELDFALEEVDSEKTPGLKPYIAIGKHENHGADDVNTGAQTSHESEALPPPAEQMEYWSAGETPEGYQPGTPLLQKNLAAVFEKYNRAAQAGDFKEVVKYMPKYQAQKSMESLSKVKDKNERLMRKKVLQDMAVRGFIVSRCTISPDGAIAALAGKGKRITGGKYQETKGTVKFLNENGSWKVAFQIWS